MRHLWSLLAGVLGAPLTWILVTLGRDGSARTVDNWVRVGTYNTANLIEPAVYLAVGGVLLGLLATLRVSPLGPLVAGALLVTPYVLLFVDPFAVLDRLPDHWRLLGDPLPLELPVRDGTLFFVGVMLLMATFSGQRWRRWPAPAALAGAPAGPTSQESAGPAPAEADPATEPESGRPPAGPGSPAGPPATGTARVPTAGPDERRAGPGTAATAPDVLEPTVDHPRPSPYGHVGDAGPYPRDGETPWSAPPRQR